MTYDAGVHHPRICPCPCLWHHFPVPLKAIDQSGKSVHAFALDAAQWQELKGSYRKLGLRMACCGEPAVPKTSSLGTFFFAHQQKGECDSAPESAEHLYCKQLVAQAAMHAGWEVTTEFPGATPDGDQWQADVYCTRGSAKVALEIQLSPQNLYETQRRQDRYEKSGVRCAWLFGPKGLSGISERAFTSKTPAFVLKDIEIGKEPEVASLAVPLGEFVKALLSKRIVWHTETESITGLILYIEDTCHHCRRAVKQIYGHVVEGYEDFQPRAYTPATLSDIQEGIARAFTRETLLQLGLNPIGKVTKIKGQPARWPYLNICRHCGASQNNFYLSKRLVQAMKAPATDPDAPFRLTPFGGPFGEARVPQVLQGRAYWKYLPKE